MHLQAIEVAGHRALLLVQWEYLNKELPWAIAMFRKKVDNRIRVQIENGVAEQHRTLFVVVGNHGRDQVVILHHMLSKATVKARPSVLWCYKKELGFSSHRKKRMRQLQKKIKSGTLNINEDDPFELFVAATNIRYCYYNETHKILGNTFGMCVLQDFEALTPNLLARTIETVEGGGIVVILLRTMNSLKKLYTMTMDVHSRYRTEAHQDVVGRFNERLTMQPPRATASEDNAALGSLQASPQAPGQTTGVAGARFILSLASCKNCVAIDDQLNILPISSHIANIKPVPPKSQEDSLMPREVELKELKESLQDTQPVGVLVDSCKTLDQAKAVLKFIEAISEKTLRSTVALTAARGRGKSAALGLAVAGAVAFGYSNIFVTSPSPDNLHTLFEFIFKGFDALEYQEHLDYEIIQSLNPEFNKAVVRVNIFKEHRQTIQLCFTFTAGKEIRLLLHSSFTHSRIYYKLLLATVYSYEGTGRSLSLKLIQQLRQQSAESQLSLTAENKTTSTARLTSARSLHEVTLHESIRYAPGDAVEKWLNNLLCLDCLNIPRIISGCPLPQSCELYPSLLLSAILLHYIAGLALLCRYYVNRDTLFCYHRASEAFLQKLMALYVASHYKNSPNDLQMLSDAPAHHLFCLLPPVPTTQNSLPEVLAVIQVCLEGEISRQSILNSLSRGKKASGDLIPWTVSEQFQDPEFGSLSGGRVIRIAVHPDYQGNDLTGENTCIMLKELNSEEASQQSNWLPAFWKVLSRAQLDADFTAYDLKRLDMYSRNMVDYHLIMDMIPNIAKMFFLKQLGDISLSAAQSALLLGIGLQHKTVDQLEREIELPSSQLMGLFNRLIRKVVQVFTSIQEKAVEEQMVASKEIVMEPTIKTLTEDLDEAAQEFQEKHKKEMEKIKEMDLTQYMIRGDDEEWNAVLNKAGQNAALVTLKSNKKRKLLDASEKEEPRQNKKLKNKNKEKNKTKRGKFNNQRLPALVAAFHGDSTLNKGSVSLSPPWVPPVTLVAVLGFPSSPLAPLLGWGAAHHNARILSVEYHRFYRNDGICSSVQNPDSCLNIKDQSERDDSTEREMGANDQDESPTAGQQPQQAELFPGHKALKMAPERDVKHLCCLLNLCVQQMEQECEEKRERAVSLASELDDNMGTLKLITEMALNDQKDAEKGIERMQKMVCKLREKEQRETQRKGNTEQSVGNESHP
ncbi:UNVERIFIED_CONTAM: hypothetical protein FKN15_017150 [Acipenser sinensis]